MITLLSTSVEPMLFGARPLPLHRLQAPLLRQTSLPRGCSILNELIRSGDTCFKLGVLHIERLFLQRACFRGGLIALPGLLDRDQGITDLETNLAVQLLGTDLTLPVLQLSRTTSALAIRLRIGILNCAPTE